MTLGNHTIVIEINDMNILILSGSPRKGGNTDLLVEAFVKGASQKHNVEEVKEAWLAYQKFANRFNPW